MIRLTCPNCGKICGITEKHAGKTIICPHCQTRTVVPSIVAGAPPSKPQVPTFEGKNRKDETPDTRKVRSQKKVRSIEKPLNTASLFLRRYGKFVLLGAGGLVCVFGLMTCTVAGIFGIIEFAGVKNAEKEPVQFAKKEPKKGEPDPIPLPIQPPPLELPVLPNNLQRLNHGSGTYLVESITRVTNLAANANVIAGYGYNDGVSIASAWLHIGQGVAMTTQLLANTDYIVLAAGDNDARVIDLEVFDSLGRLVVQDQTNNPEAMVAFRAQANAKYTIRLTLIHSDKNVPCICSAVTLKRNGWNVPFQNLDNATLSLAKFVAELDRTKGQESKKKIGFRHAPGEWAVFGGVLNQGVDMSMSNLNLGIGERYVVGVSDGTSTNLDLHLWDKDRNVVGRPQGMPSSVPYFLFKATGPGNGLLLRNVTSPRGAALTMMAVLECN